MSPRPSEPPSDETLAELGRLATNVATAETDLRTAVLAALDAGGSVRTVAAAANLSPTTVQTWKNRR